ncbi:MAG: MFS transporter [Pseudanabaenales cyanobacterium]|nr:MFS transporter [Pseudanabaenales cyanobacterium]
MQSKETFNLPLKFWIVALIAFTNSVGYTLIIPILYPYAKAFGLNDFEASLLTTAYAASQFIATPILGRLSDCWGRKPLLVISLIGTVLANIVASLAPFAWLLFAARILDGLTGGNTSIAQAVISDITHPAQRTKAFGIFGATFRLGFVAGPTLSYLAQNLPTPPGVSSLGMGFLVSAAMASIAMVLCLCLLSETLPQRCEFQFTWRDFGLNKVAQSAVNPRLGRIFMATFLSGFTFIIFAFAFQPFFLNVLHQDAKTLALVFAIFGVLGFITQFFALDRLIQRFSLVNILTVTLAIRGIIFLLMPTFPDLLAFFFMIVIFGVINSFPLPLIDSILSLKSQQQEQGKVLGVNASYLSISKALGPATAGMLVSLGYQTPLWVAGVLTWFTAWFALGLRSREGPRFRRG